MAPRPILTSTTRPRYPTQDLLLERRLDLFE